MTHQTPTVAEETRFHKGLLKVLLVGFALGMLMLGAGWLVYSGPAVWTKLVAWVTIDARTPWYIARSSGTVAYLLLAGSTIWGLLLTSKIVSREVPAVLSLAMHNLLSWLAILLSMLHAFVLLFDGYYEYRLVDIMVPFLGPYRPGWVGLGIVSLYLLVALALSFRIRRRFGQKRWRQLHYLSFLAFVMITVHGIVAGTDTGNIGMQAIYWLSGLLVIFLINFRLLTSKTSRRTNRSHQ